MTQKQALDIMKLGHNVFLTGEPGAGKTHTLNKFVDYCLKHDIGIGVTASTGIAATHINGMTIHSWSGIGIKDQINEDQLMALAKKQHLKARFKKTRVLIIDEVSMLDGARLDMINQVCKYMKRSSKPFGGLQVILSGDLFQLPPVTKNRQNIDYAYKSDAWAEARLRVCYLQEQHRTEDSTLLSLLRDIRTNQNHDTVYEVLEARMYEDVNDDTTRLYTHNADVDEVNRQKLETIEGESKTFSMTALGNDRYAERLKSSCLAPEELQLKVGAQIICVANNPAKGFVNGSRGEVIDFDGDKPVIKLQDGKEISIDRHQWSMDDGDKQLASVSQFPLRLAWAITVHKSQGMSLDEAEIDLSKAFTPGMGYVAISRVRHLDGLSLRGVNNVALQVSRDVAEFDEYLRELSEAAVDSLNNIPKKTLKKLTSIVKVNLSQDYAEYDKDLFEKLKDWRTSKAKKESVAPYMVLSDKSLIAVAAEKPKTSKKLDKLHGFGEVKIKKYGKEIQKLVNQSSGKMF